MIFIIIFAISLATIFFLSWWHLSSTHFCSFCFGFLGLIFGALIGMMFCALVSATICDDPDHLTDTETYQVAQINITKESEILASNYTLNYILDEDSNSKFIVYIIKNDTLIRLKVRPEHIHFVTTDTARVVKNTYHFKTKLCRLLFEFTSIYSYEYYAPMQPLTSS